MSWFGSRNRAERGELKKHKKALKSVRKATKRELEIGELKDKTRLRKAKTAYKKAKGGTKSKSRPLINISISKKKQGKKLSRRSKIRLF